MSNLDFTSASTGFDDGGFFAQNGDDNAFADSLLQFTAYGDGYNAFTDVQQSIEHGGDVFFNQAFEPTFEQQSDLEDTLATASPSSIASPTPSEAHSNDSTFSLSISLDDVGFITPSNKHDALPAPLTTSNYTPLLNEPAPPVPTTIYPTYSGYFANSADAKAHRRRARLPPKSQALDIARVKHFGRNYWVRRLYNAMVDISAITDGESSIHRTRFTQKLGKDQDYAFDPLDLEATAHHIFDEAIAVHERGWNRPTVYHKNAVRGKLVDVSETSLELRLSRICLCLQQKKSVVDDAIRGGVTLALLCDNPEARSFTKASNDVGNKKRGERLRVTSTKERAKKKTQGAHIQHQGINIRDQELL